MPERIQVQIVLPERSEDDLSEALRRLTAALEEATGEHEGYGMGGEHGYGFNYESDLFLIHRYCWCESDDCPWCGGCGGQHEDPEHAQDCYQWRVYRDLLNEGFLPDHEIGRTYARAPDGWSWERRRKVEDRIRKKWCEHFGLDFPSRCAVHCTCGAHEEWLKRLAACTCEHCTASGAWASAGALPKRGAPNFWYKPTGLRVWWYKWIGRSMEIEGDPATDPVAAVEECIANIRPEEPS